ncbi:deoxyguanosinetriphosphate triphosphohydrolase [Bifidobacterium anseris]|uniref:Deoxyguanosinetriphosphate triphosphohydrolase n=1 Tax=Bifidobacterium anseris TaxID=2020963 RepID=A0A2N5J2U6_9BIFI|nr:MULTISPECIES: deoxyguanosinetriphosphate triphosphohydrolase [Bifidobacterium]PLS28542.1 deoxyguanosinetriphosphate triphosphohydrolase [Bifidobacterium anseris]
MGKESAIGEPTPDGYTAHDVERWVGEAPKSGRRTPFERDRARLIHSSALRRLGAKSQILVAGTDDFARTRLTHTLEVAQIGRQIAQMLGCDPDVVDCACLAHDLGHPPFGHNGERALAALAKDIGGFEGNAQTFRLLTRLEPKIFRTNGRSAGVNLTRACLDASVKYPWDYARADAHPKGERSRKFGVYPDDTDVFRWLKQGAPDETVPLEGQVMDLADDIAYSVHDFEDAVAIGAADLGDLARTAVVDAIVREIIAWYGPQWNPDELVRAFGRLRAIDAFPQTFDGSRRALAQLKNVTSMLIGRFALSVEAAMRAIHGPGALTRYAGALAVPDATRYEILVLKGIAVHYLMEPRDHSPMQEDEQRIVTDLVEVIMNDRSTPPFALERVFWEDWMDAADDGARLRVAIDQVASLTDASAMTMHTLLCS